MEENHQSRGFLLKQRAFLKLYLLDYIQSNKSYGRQFVEDLRKEFEPYAYAPTHSEVYKCLHDLYREGYLKREKKLLGEQGGDFIGKKDATFQEIIVYHMTEEGKAKLETYRKTLKVELERCIGLLTKGLNDHFGPVRKGKKAK
ncbi:Replication termination protein [Peribacillus kribbensis]|uniref:Replication termination protein n=1 Tax=Peribacillus kribbensis TaxID=356658 RepID=UPI0003FB2047|nr:Replication termination protein [Peribacillus kribbensis]